MSPTLDSTVTLPDETGDIRRHPAHVGVILSQIETLPTLPAIANRLLTITADDRATAEEVVSLIGADPALTARVISMSRRSDDRVRGEGSTVKRAVMLLGFGAVRNAVLSLKVLDAFDHGPDRSGHFDAREFWRHCLAVAIAAEMVAERETAANLIPGEAFVAGLLHDIGKLALSEILPKSYARVIARAEADHGEISQCERSVLGIDHHTAGKRLAEHWQLPFALQDCIWLHGTPLVTLPDLPHRRLIGLVGLADLIARRQHIGFSGNFVMGEQVETMAIALGFAPAVIEDVGGRLHEEVHQRAELLGLDDAPCREMFLRSIAGANAALGRLNNALQRRHGESEEQKVALAAIRAFHSVATAGRTVADVVHDVAASFAACQRMSRFALCAPLPAATGTEPSWLYAAFDGDGARTACDVVPGPPGKRDAEAPPATWGAWLNQRWSRPEGSSPPATVVLPSGWGAAGILQFDERAPRGSSAWEALCRTWGTAIAAAAQHEGARQLGDQLAEVNRTLAEAQQELVEQATMARLGALASGAAHEMNNPLTVISGQSQRLLDMVVGNLAQQRAASSIVEASERLSGLITSLHEFADHPVPHRMTTDMAGLLNQIVSDTAADLEADAIHLPITLQVGEGLPSMWIDPDQFRDALRSLLVNAVQAEATRSVHLSLRWDAGDEQMIVEVKDDGEGMPPEVVEHAIDPFFSAKPAGRRIGMGLTRARGIIEAHGGTLALTSGVGNGTRVVISLPPIGGRESEVAAGEVLAAASANVP